MNDSDIIEEEHGTIIKIIDNPINNNGKMVSIIRGIII